MENTEKQIVRHLSQTNQMVDDSEKSEAMLWEKYNNRLGIIVEQSRSALRRADERIKRESAELKLTEEALQSSREQLRQLFELANDGICVIDSNGVIMEVNDMMIQNHGYSSNYELYGKEFLELFKRRDHRRVRRNIQRAMAGRKVKSVEYTFLKSDGSEFIGEMSVSVLKTKRKATRIIAITRDITERRKAEAREKQLQLELNNASRLRSIGLLAAGVAHEINNPLTGILGFSERLLRKDHNENNRLDLERIHRDAERVAKIVQNLLTFARHREPKKEYCDINEILEKALELRSYELKTGNIEVITDLSYSLPKVMADFHQIQQVFLNLILNAEQAMAGMSHQGKLHIKTELEKDHIKILFVDNGPGIKSQYLDQIFTPFFSTRTGEGGTGLGLSVCHGIVTEHGGRITFKNNPEGGAKFTIELPLTKLL